MFKIVLLSLAWLDVDSVPHVSKSLYEHCWQKDREKHWSQYAPLLDTVCHSKCIQGLSSILDIAHYSGMQTFNHGCELFGASIFPQQLPQSSLPNGVECLRKVDKDNIQKSVLLYVILLEDHVHCSPVWTKAALRLWHNRWGDVA